ncbi:MAG: cytochrome c-type biogenesis protein CcmH [Betaproteobacteria bacterium]|nr:MAG: cytochrome c-type biogenesis protein CcmH [Betaproteobacteria bacterium]
MRWIWFAALLAFASATFGADSPLVFDSAEQETRFKKLMTELRCLVCQNQSLEDSHAPLAQDLRNQAYAMMRDGASDDDIMDYMVDRYGEFVRYRPAFSPLTFLLWFGPLLLFLIAAAVAWRWLGAQQAAAGAELSEADDARARRLLNGKSPRKEKQRK